MKKKQQVQEEQRKREEELKKKQQQAIKSTAPPPAQSSPSAIKENGDIQHNEEEDAQKRSHWLAKQRDNHSVIVKAIFKFDAEEEDELNFRPGEEFIVIQKEDEKWWWGEKCDGSVGLFPHNFALVMSGDPKKLKVRDDDENDPGNHEDGDQESAEDGSTEIQRNTTTQQPQHPQHTTIPAPVSLVSHAPNSVRPSEIAKSGVLQGGTTASPGNRQQGSLPPSRTSQPPSGAKRGPSGVSASPTKPAPMTSPHPKPHPATKSPPPQPSQQQQGRRPPPQQQHPQQQQPRPFGGPASPQARATFSPPKPRPGGPGNNNFRGVGATVAVRSTSPVRPFTNGGGPEDHSLARKAGTVINRAPPLRPAMPRGPSETTPPSSGFSLSRSVGGPPNRAPPPRPSGPKPNAINNSNNSTTPTTSTTPSPRATQPPPLKTQNSLPQVRSPLPQQQHPPQQQQQSPLRRPPPGHRPAVPSGALKPTLQSEQRKKEWNDKRTSVMMLRELRAVENTVFNL